jgi:hypothetical protein
VWGCTAIVLVLVLLLVLDFLPAPSRMFRHDPPRSATIRHDPPYKRSGRFCSLLNSQPLYPQPLRIRNVSDSFNQLRIVSSAAAVE